MPDTDNFYSLSQQEIFEKLNTSEKGLSQSEAQDRLQQYGKNQLTAKKKISPLAIFLEQFKNSLILILIGAALLVFVVYYFGERDSSDLIEGGLILAIVLMITALGFIQEYKAEKAVEALKKLLAYKAKVIRDGKESEVDVTQLVPGDVVILEEGAKVPADIRVLDVSNLSTLEASLTGESTPVSKSVEKIEGEVALGDQKNMVFSSTVIASGRGKGVVARTGDKTEIGKIASMVSEVEDSSTPLQKRLDEIGKVIGYAVLGIAAVVFIFIVFFSETAKEPLLQRFLDSFIAAIALAVAAIPEGLPAVVTISLALGTQRMLKRNALVRKLNSIETLGSTDVICSDKTGTLTKNEMTVQQIYYNGKTYQVTGTGYETTGEFTVDGKNVNPSELKLLLTIGLACNDASLKDGKIIGDPTEGALLVSAAKAGVTAEIERLKEIPFSSVRKMMSVADEDQGKIMVYAKGAPEVVLEHCSKIIDGGKEVDLTQKEKEKVLQKVEEMSKEALRTLGFAYKKTNKVEEDDKEMESNLTFVGLQGMIDPPREEVPDLIQQCKNSGIRVIMITGDHLATAVAIANEIGVEGKGMSGVELDKLSAQELEEVVKNTNIYARVSPDFKMKIIDILKKEGHIVAMTGDGVNDAPAVKKADIGVAMGITGTDVAKEASDMVLLDDNFGTIVRAIEEGRGIFDNIRKFVNYLLSCNIGEVILVFAAVIIFQHLPLSAVMLLWINVVTDGLPAIALGLDPAQKNIMKLSPKKYQEQIINARLWWEMIIFGILMTVGVLGLYAFNYFDPAEGPAEARAAAFMAVVIFELVRLLIIRFDYKTSLFSNLWLIVAVTASILFQVLIVYVPFLAEIFEIKHIDWFDWGYILVASFVLWLIFELMRKTINFIFDSRSDNTQPSKV